MSKNEFVCDCGQTVTLIPHKDYMVEYWEDCQVRNKCKDCKVLDTNEKLLAKVKEIFD